MTAVRWRRWGREALVVVLPMAAVLAVPDPFGYGIAAGLFTPLLLPLRLRWPRLTVVLCAPAMLGGFGWGAMIVALFALGRRLPRIRTLTGFVLVAAAGAFVPVLLFQSLTVGSYLLSAAFSLLAAGAPAALGALMTVREQYAESLRKLAAATDEALRARAGTARAEERARIAREIHDAVGHHTTLIAVESAALSATSKEPETQAAAERVRMLAKQALAEMRQTLGLGAEDPAGEGPVKSIEELVWQARATGLDVRLDGEIAVRGLPDAVERAAYRVVQEALTNATKYAPGAGIRVRLEEQDGALHVAISNGAPNGSGIELGGGGSGLAGLTERVRLVGGRIDARACADGGFELVAVLPQQR